MVLWKAGGHGNFRETSESRDVKDHGVPAQIHLLQWRNVSISNLGIFDRSWVSAILGCCLTRQGGTKQMSDQAIGAQGQDTRFDDFPNAWMAQVARKVDYRRRRLRLKPKLV